MGAFGGDTFAQALQLLRVLLLPTLGLLTLSFQFLPGGRERPPRRGEFPALGALGGQFGRQFGAFGRGAVAQRLQLLLQLLLPAPGLLTLGGEFLPGGGQGGPRRRELTGGGALGGQGGLFRREGVAQGLQLLLPLLLPTPGLLALGFQFLPGGRERPPRRGEFPGLDALRRQFGGQAREFGRGAGAQSLQLLLPLLSPAPGLLALGHEFLLGGRERGPRRCKLGRSGALRG